MIASLPKPRLRGRVHQIAFFVSIPQGLVLVVAAAHGWLATFAAAVYAATASGLYGVSALYHRLRWSPRALPRMRKLDHSMIFLLIAGTYTPIGLLVLEGLWSTVLLAAVWAGAAAGVVLKLVSIERTRRLTAAMYIILGWLAVAAAPKLIGGMSPVALALIVAGGLVYTAGAIVLATKRPDPNPYVFGYHEVWHVAVVCAGALHYAAIVMLLLGA